MCHTRSKPKQHNSEIQPTNSLTVFLNAFGLDDIKDRNHLEHIFKASQMSMNEKLALDLRKLLNLNSESTPYTRIKYEILGPKINQRGLSQKLTLKDGLTLTQENVDKICKGNDKHCKKVMVKAQKIFTALGCRENGGPFMALQIY